MKGYLAFGDSFASFRPNGQFYGFIILYNEPQNPSCSAAHCAASKPLGEEAVMTRYGYSFVTQSGSYELNEQHYKRNPKGDDPAHERAEWLLYNALYAHPQQSIPLAQVCSPNIIDTCLAHF